MRRDRKGREVPGFLNKTTVHLTTALGLLFCGLFVWYGLRHGLFTSQEALRTFMEGFGIWGGAAFVLFQAVQVVVPILPGKKKIIQTRNFFSKKYDILDVDRG